MTTKHTPGPWVAEFYCHLSESTTDTGEGSFQIVSNAESQEADVLCSRLCWPEREEEMHANARLIAAAPDMLQVLQDLQESAAYWSEYDVPLGIVERIHAAIAKATGPKEPAP